MIKGKLNYLNKLQPKFASKRYDSEKIDGSSPPAVFIGRYGYPKVFIGPLIPATHGNTIIMDTPELWLCNNKTLENIIDFRFGLVRGKTPVHIKDDSRIVERIREVALAEKSLDIEAEFNSKPRGGFFHEELQPFGPSATLKTMEINNPKINKRIEKAHGDTDLRARDAIIYLYEKGLFTSYIQKALSVGAFGLGSNRKLVPTRWSITAVDDMLGKNMLDEIKQYTEIDKYHVYEHRQLNNYFAVLLMPTCWQYEFLEAFIKVLGNEELLFSDCEPYSGKTDYAAIGGCYYAAKLGVLEKLKEMKRQAGVIIFRESYPGYTPLGVWLVRETMREAMKKKETQFENMSSALDYISKKLWLPILRYRKQSILLKQKTLDGFCE